jgi:hypothetical protein
MSTSLAYTQVNPQQRSGETKSLLSVVCGVLGIIGGLILPIIGLALAIAGVVFGTMSRQSIRRWQSTVGIILSSLAILVSLGMWVYVVQQDSKPAKTDKNAKTSITATLATDCYSANFIDRLNVVGDGHNCDTTAYNAETLDTSSNAYKVFASKSKLTDTAAFTDTAKQALEDDIKTNLPEFNIDTERVAGFAGSPAYSVTASSKSQGVAVIETAVYHQAKTGDNVFILVHAVDDKTADLKILEAQWQWK